MNFFPGCDNRQQPIHLQSCVSLSVLHCALTAMFSIRTPVSAGCYNKLKRGGGTRPTIKLH